MNSKQELTTRVVHSPSLASIAEAIHDAKEYGFPEVGPATFDWNTLKHKRDAYIKRLNGIYERNLEKDSVDYISGMASFVSNDSVTLGNGEKIHAKKILIAVGMFLSTYLHFGS